MHHNYFIDNSIKMPRKGILIKVYFFFFVKAWSVFLFYPKPFNIHNIDYIDCKFVE